MPGKDKLDVRTYDRYLEKGLLTKEEVQKHFKSLPDETANAVTVEIEFLDGELAEKSNDEE